MSGYLDFAVGPPPGVNAGGIKTQIDILGLDRQQNQIFHILQDILLNAFDKRLKIGHYRFFVGFYQQSITVLVLRLLVISNKQLVFDFSRRDGRFAPYFVGSADFGISNLQAQTKY